MKKKIFILIISVFTGGIFVSAQQPFAPVGAKWYYNETTYSPSWVADTTYILLESTENAIVGGKLCSVIRNVKGGMFCYDYMFTPTYVYQSNDTVYFYEGQNRFAPVYIWNVQAGDSWDTLFGITVTVDSVKTVSVFGQSWKEQYVTYQSTPIEDNEEYRDSYQGVVIENIGDLFYLYAFMVNSLSTCDEFFVSYGGLRCYVHPEFGTYHTGNLSCDYQTSATENIKTEDVKFFNDYIQLPDNLKTQTTKIRIFNTIGQCILSAIPDDNGQISINNLGKGIYIVSVISKSNNIFKNFKIIKS